MSRSEAAVAETGPGRNPARTREAILAAARALMAESGPERLSVSEVARRAGVNRGTAYQHFRDREHLVRAVKEWMSAELTRLLREDRPVDERLMTMVEFAAENPELSRLWLFDLLSREDSEPAGFFASYVESVSRFAKTDRSRAGIDPHVFAAIMVSSILLWPIWDGTPPEDARARRRSVRRFTRELLRLLLFGALPPERWPDLAQAFGPGRGDPSDGTGG